MRRSTLALCLTLLLPTFGSGCYTVNHGYQGEKLLTNGPGLDQPTRVVRHFEAKATDKTVDYARLGQEHLGQAYVDAYNTGQITKAEKNKRLTNMDLTTDYKGNVVKPVSNSLRK